LSRPWYALSLGPLDVLQSFLRMAVTVEGLMKALIKRVDSTPLP
jgi:hypothetical protein